jgi:uncharacterized protein YneF (UPF0154 family)
MGRLFTVIVIGLGIAGLFFVARDYFEEQKVKKNPWIEEIRYLVTGAQEKDAEGSVNDPWFADEGRFFSLLAMMHETERTQYDLENTLMSACSGIPASQLVQDALLNNYQLAKTFRVFDQPTNLLAMENGDPPVAVARGWEDHKLVIGHRISPLLAPEAAKSLVNMLLMPEALRDLQVVDAGGFTLETVKKWSLEKLIVPESAEAIAELVRQRDDL